MASLNEAMEEWTGGPHGPVPAAVALSHVTLRALTLPEAASYFTQRRKEKGLTSLSPSSLHPGGLKEVLGSREASCRFIFAYSPARPLCPELKAWCLPRHSHCLPFSPQRPPHPTLATAEAIATGCFDPVGPRSKTLLLFTLPFLPSEVAGLVAWQKACLRLLALCLQGEGPSLDKVSFAMTQSQAFLTCRAWSCIGSCDTKGICPTSPSLVLSTVHHQPGQVLPPGLAAGSCLLQHLPEPRPLCAGATCPSSSQALCLPVLNLDPVQVSPPPLTQDSPN